MERFTTETRQNVTSDEVECVHSVLLWCHLCLCRWRQSQFLTQNSSLDSNLLQHRAGGVEATWTTGQLSLHVLLDDTTRWRTKEGGTRLLSLLLLDPWCCHSPTGPARHRLFMCKVSSEDARSSRHTNINVLRDASNQRIKSSTVEFTDKVDSWFYCFSSNTVKQTPLNITSAESVLENRTSIWMIFNVKFTRSLPASCWINSLSIRSELRSVWNIGAKRFRQHILLEDSHFDTICVFIRVKQFRASHPRITSLIRPNPVQAGGREEAISCM